MKANNKIILFGMLLVTLFLFSFGTTYAMFKRTVTGNDDAKTFTIQNSTVGVTIDGSLATSTDGVEPSNDTPFATQTYTVTNVGAETVYYMLYWQELYNELVPKDNDSEDELYITATCTSYANYGESTQAVSGTCKGFTKYIPTQVPLFTYTNGTLSDTYKIKEEISIASGVTNIYSISVYFKNESYDQSYNQGKEFYGSIGVAESTQLPAAKSSLSAYTWDQIKTLSDALVAGIITSSELSSIYNINVGDTTASVSITTTGGYDEDGELITTSNIESHTFRLVGLNHDVDANGNTLGMTFEQTDLMNNTYVMKSTMASSDSWDNSDLKTTINNFTLPSDLNSVITSAKKPCVTSVTNSTITYVTSKLWIMSQTEIAGTQTYIYGNAVEGTQYAYYVTECGAASSTECNARIKQISGSDDSYWLRSAFSWNEARTNFALVNSYGGIFRRVTSKDEGIAVCFCI